MPPRRTSTTNTVYSPWKHPVSTPYRTIVAQHKTTMDDVEMSGEHENAIYRPIDSILNYQALAQSQKLASTGRYLTIGPQGPIFSHGKPSPASAAGSGSMFLFACLLVSVTENRISPSSVFHSRTKREGYATQTRSGSARRRGVRVQFKRSVFSSLLGRVHDLISAHSLPCTFSFTSLPSALRQSIFSI